MKPGDILEFTPQWIAEAKVEGYDNNCYDRKFKYMGDAADLFGERWYKVIDIKHSLRMQVKAASVRRIDENKS